MSTNEQEKFNQWWDECGFNSVILRAAAWEAWMARAKAEQPQPAEDPDEWVVQDRVPIRDAVDQGRYQLKETRPSNDATWYALADMNMKTRGLMHGATHPYDSNCMLFVRCRRRDLPKVEKAEQALSNSELKAVCDDVMRWQAERWPKYYHASFKANQIAFVRRDNFHQYTPVMHDGTELKQQPWFGDDNCRIELDESEAMALLKKPEPVAEDEETVDNELRDQVAAFIGNYYGDQCDEYEEACIICKRWSAFRELFELPGPTTSQSSAVQPTKTRVRLFRSLIDGLVVAESECPDSDWQEIHHDSEGFYVEGGQS